MGRVIQLTIFLTCSVLIAGSVSALSFWSIGTFSVKENADRERDRIASETGLAIEIIVSGDLYRVVLEQDDDPELQKDMIEALGITPWTLPDIRPDTRPEPVPMAEVDPMPAEEVDYAPPETGYYLVLASFLDDISPAALQDRLAADGIEPTAVMKAEVAGQSYYRLVLGPFSERYGVDTDYSEYGIRDTWWLRASASLPVAEKKEITAEAEKPAMRVIESRQESVEEVLTAEEPVYSISPPQAGESYVNYCLRRANKMERAIYCRDGAFNRISTAERRVKEDRGADLEYCALLATPKERQELCRDTAD